MPLRSMGRPPSRAREAALCALAEVLVAVAVTSPFSKKLLFMSSSRSDSSSSSS